MKIKCTQCKKEFDYSELKQTITEISRKSDAYSFTYRKECPYCSNAHFTVGIEAKAFRDIICETGIA